MFECVLSEVINILIFLMGRCLLTLPKTRQKKSTHCDMSVIIQDKHFCKNKSFFNFLNSSSNIYFILHIIYDSLHTGIMRFLKMYDQPRVQIVLSLNADLPPTPTIQCPNSVLTCGTVYPVWAEPDPILGGSAQTTNHLSRARM